MNNSIKTLFFGLGVVGCVVLAKIIKNNKSKINALILTIIETWEKNNGITEAKIVSTSPIDEVKTSVA